MTYHIAYCQEKGSPRQQQDSLLIQSEVFQHAQLAVGTLTHQDQELVLAVADGIASSPRAQLASQLVLEQLARALSAGTTPDGKLIRQLQSALASHYGRGKTLGCSTTIAVLACRNGRAQAFNAGDSRIYHISAAGEWQQLSHDHTFLNTLIANGEAQRNEAYASIYNTLESYLVADPEDPTFPLHYRDIALHDGDRFLLCSDGLHDTLGDDELQAQFNPVLTPAEQVTCWRDAVIRLGAPDNLTIAMVHLHDISADH